MNGVGQCGRSEIAPGGCLDHKGLVIRPMRNIRKLKRLRGKSGPIPMT